MIRATKYAPLREQASDVVVEAWHNLMMARHSIASVELSVIAELIAEYECALMLSEYLNQ